VLVFAGCTPPGRPVEATGSETPGSRAGQQSIDPQILTDVIDTVFPLPGAGMLRALRVQQFYLSYRNVRCGGRPLPLDNTAGRIDQARFPDLDLMATEGLSEPVDPNEELLVPHDSCTSAPQLPSFAKWFELLGPWNDLAVAAEQSPPALAAKKPIGACFASAGHAIDGVDSAEPIQSFFALADAASYRAASRAEQRRIQHTMGKIYARCTERYFAVTRAYLAKRRPALIERNRELLDRVAREFAAAGYVP
jgi:hypothetical protein